MHQPPPVPPHLLAQSISLKVIAGSEVKSLIVVYSEQPKLFLSMEVSMETLNLKICLDPPLWETYSHDDYLLLVE